MRIIDKISDSGWGALFLAIYSLGVAYMFIPESIALTPVGLLPALVVILLADRFNFQLIHFFAGDKLQRSTEQINQITGEQDFYESASEELQNRVDEFDRHAYRSNVSILSGSLIAITAPILGFYLGDLAFIAGGMIVAILASLLFVRHGVRQLNRLAQNITEPYQAKYENQ